MARKPKDFDNILARMKEGENWIRSYYPRWQRALRIYNSQHEPGSKAASERDGCGPMHFIPYPFMLTETSLARLTDRLFANRPYVSVLPRGEGMREKANDIANLLDWQISDRMHLPEIFKSDILQTLCQLGTAIAYITWDIKTRRRRRWANSEVEVTDPNTGLPLLDIATGQPIIRPERVVIESMEREYDDPAIRAIDLFDFLIDPVATSIDNARWCGHREYMNKRQIEERVENAKWQVDWKIVKPDGMDGQSGQEIRLDIGRQERPGNTASDLYAVHHYWEDDRHIVIISGNQCALDERNPFWHGRKPYLRGRYTSQANQFFGIGMIDCMGDLPHELNVRRDQMDAYLDLKLGNPFIVREGSKASRTNINLRVNKVIPSEETDDIKQIVIGDVPSSAFATEEMIKADMRDATGVQDIIMGTSGADETATTSMVKDTNAGIRFANMVDSVSGEMLVPIVQMIFILDQQFLDEERAARVIKADPSNIYSSFVVTPEDLDADYDVIYVGTSSEPLAAREMRKQQAIEAYNILSASPLYQQDPEAQINLMRATLQEIGIRDIESVLPRVMPQPQPQPQQAGADMGGQFMDIPIDAGQAQTGMNTDTLQGVNPTLGNGMPEMALNGPMGGNI